MSEIAFTKVRLPYGWLGNMAPFPVEYDGREWRTTEALFQALRFQDRPSQEKIRDQKSPMAAKMAAKALVEQMTIVPQSREDLANMVMVLGLKLAQHPTLGPMLCSTGDSCIIEDCTSRPRGSGLFWGASRQIDGTWLGKNHLGRMWEALRKEIQDVLQVHSNSNL